MLPDWDFNGDEAKRRTFIEWVWAELDRLATLTTERLVPASDRDWTALRGARLSRPVGHPPEPTTGMNALVWEYALVRYIFARYWPGRKRPTADPASAARIAVARNRVSLPRHQRTSDRIAVYRGRGDELVDALLAEWKRGSKSPGRKAAAADIAFLDTLPAHLFAR